jgi:hypothetical protein
MPDMRDTKSRMVRHHLVVELKEDAASADKEWVLQRGTRPTVLPPPSQRLCG